MKIRAVATGEVIDLDEEGAKILIEARIYEAVDAFYDALNAARHDGDPPPVLTKMAKPITGRRPRQ